MKSLADRHEDRVKRMAMNRADTNTVPAGSVATAEALFRDAIAYRNRLSQAELRELDETLKVAEQNGEFDSARSLAEAPDGSGATMAGIGVVNVKVVPASVLSAEAGNGGGTDGWDASGQAGWGETAPVTVAGTPETPDLGGSNVNGAALEAQGAAGDGADAGGASAPANRRAKAGTEG